MTTATENDALGGAGSIKDALLGIALNGLSRKIDGRLSQKYGLTAFNETQAVTATGQATQSGAPQEKGSPGAQVAAFFNNPVALAIGAAVSLSVLIVFLTKR